MAKNNPDSIQVKIADLEHLINNLIVVLSQHPQYLENHEDARESLTQAVEHLNNIINQQYKPELTPYSRQLMQVINTFVEYYINPQFYRTTNQLQLPKATNPNLRDVKRLQQGN